MYVAYTLYALLLFWKFPLFVVLCPWVTTFFRVSDSLWDGLGRRGTTYVGTTSGSGCAKESQQVYSYLPYRLGSCNNVELSSVDTAVHGNVAELDIGGSVPSGHSLP